MEKLSVPGFSLGDQLTNEQTSFFHTHGILLFKNFLTPAQVQCYLAESKRIEKMWLAEGRDKVNGIPLKFGKDTTGETII